MQRSLFISATLSGASILVGLFSVASAEAATLTHLYQLNNTLTDSLGGSSLMSNGGTFGAGGYTFGANQGPSLSNTLNADNYSILMDFSINEVSGYRKLIDFKDLSSDLGLYNLNGSLAFYNSAFTSGTSFAANTLARLVITRDTTNNFFGYVNGVQQISFADSGNLAKFNSTNNNIHFLRDDFATGGEAAGGVLAKIAIYDGALNAQEVRALGGTNTPINPTPVPTPVLLPGLIGLGLGVLKKRKAEVSKAAIEA